MEAIQGIAFDVDGTAVEDGEHTINSPLLIDAFAELPDDFLTIMSTGRSPQHTVQISEQLQQRHQAIVANGALIIDARSREILWERELSTTQVAGVLAICSSLEYSFVFSEDRPTIDKRACEQVARPSASVFLIDVPEEVAYGVVAKMRHVPDTYTYVSKAWHSANSNYFDVNISHAEATKGHALRIVLEMHGIDPARVVGVGDGHNDHGLFDAVGYKVAVADGDQELIERADEVIGSVAEDGLAKFLSRLASPDLRVEPPVRD